MSAEILLERLERNRRGENTPLERGSLPEENITMHS